MAAGAASCQAVGESFVPLITGSFGGWSECATKILSSIEWLLGHRLSVSSEATRRLFQRCAICLWQGNSILSLLQYPLTLCLVL